MSLATFKDAARAVAATYIVGVALVGTLAAGTGSPTSLGSIWILGPALLVCAADVLPRALLSLRLRRRDQAMREALAAGYTEAEQARADLGLPTTTFRDRRAGT